MSLSGLVSLVLGVTTALGAGEPALAVTSQIDAALQAHYGVDAPRRYRHALVDLDGDSVPDAVVLTTDGLLCGSGGCTLVVLRGTGRSFSYVSASTIARQPIRVLRETRHGWKSLSVTVAGGGGTPGNALMRFDGKRYPLNPSMQPTAGRKALADATELKFSE